MRLQGLEEARIRRGKVAYGERGNDAFWGDSGAMGRGSRLGRGRENLPAGLLDGPKGVGEGVNRDSGGPLWPEVARRGL